MQRASFDCTVHCCKKSIWRLSLCATMCTNTISYRFDSIMECGLGSGLNSIAKYDHELKSSKNFPNSVRDESNTLIFVGYLVLRQISWLLATSWRQTHLKLDISHWRIQKLAYDVYSHTLFPVQLKCHLLAKTFSFSV